MHSTYDVPHSSSWKIYRVLVPEVDNRPAYFSNRWNILLVYGLTWSSSNMERWKESVLDCIEIKMPGKTLRRWAGGRTRYWWGSEGRWCYGKDASCMDQAYTEIETQKSGAEIETGKKVYNRVEVVIWKINHRSLRLTKKGQFEVRAQKSACWD